LGGRERKVGEGAAAGYGSLGKRISQFDKD
jgi:hypothetical protein